MCAGSDINTHVCLKPLWTPSAKTKYLRRANYAVLCVGGENIEVVVVVVVEMHVPYSNRIQNIYIVQTERVLGSQFCATSVQMLFMRCPLNAIVFYGYPFLSSIR